MVSTRAVRHRQRLALDWCPPPARRLQKARTGGGRPRRPYMLGQLWVVDDPDPDPEPEPGDALVAAGDGDTAARAGPARASAAPLAAPITGTAARSQSFLGSRIAITSFLGLTRLQRLWTPS